MLPSAWQERGVMAKLERCERQVLWGRLFLAERTASRPRIYMSMKS